MKKFIEKLLSFIVEDGNYKVNEENQNQINVITIFAPEENIGKIIGKEGKVINAIRCLCRLKSNQSQEKIVLNVEKL